MTLCLAKPKWQNWSIAEFAPFQSRTWAVPPPPCVHQQHHLLEQMQAGFWVEILDFIQNFLHILYRFFEITSSSHTYFILITWGMKVWHPCLIGKGLPGGCMWGTWRNVLEIDLRDRNADVYLITAQFIPYCFIFYPFVLKFVSLEPARSLSQQVWDWLHRRGIGEEYQAQRCSLV